MLLDEYEFDHDAVVQECAFAREPLGDIATDDAYRLVRRRAEAGSYDRVLLLLTDRRSPLARIGRRSLEARLRRVLNVPVQAVGHPQFALPVLSGQ
jgi:hypothetical protein